MNIKSLVVSGVLAVAISAPIAQAAETDTYVISGTYGQTGYVYTPGMGSAAAEVVINNTGVNQTASLMHWSSGADGFKYWRGDIPASAVVSNGMDSISVSINTCEVNNVYGCGQVDLTVRADVPATGWIDNGVGEYTAPGYVYRQVGARTTRFATSTGYVNGYPVDSARAYINKGTDVTVTVTYGE